MGIYGDSGVVVEKLRDLIGRKATEKEKKRAVWPEGTGWPGPSNKGGVGGGGARWTQLLVSVDDPVNRLTLT